MDKASYSNKFYPLLICIAFCFAGCGPSKDKGGGSGGGKKGDVQKQFELTAGDDKIPARMMMAVAFLESGISPVKQSTPYYAGEQVDIGTTLTETAFGVTRRELGIHKDENAADLRVQIAAYGKWVREKLDKDSFELKANPAAADEKYWWIWKLSQFHRNGDELTRNIRVVWALNMIKILNAGFVWQDPVTGEKLELKKESPPLEIEKLPLDAKNWLEIEYDASDIDNARMFQLTSSDTTTLENVPNHIEVIHCPLSLSGCLELQDTSRDNDLGLGAHYVIPQDDSLVPRALQIQQHERPVLLTRENGEKKYVTDAIVIMLVGNSGQYEDGVRVNADPTWFTSWQLTKMGVVISNVCNVLDKKYEHVNARACQTPGLAEGVHVQSQGARSTYRWGDVPDFDESIFYSYLKSADHSLQAEVQIQFDNVARTFKAGKNINFLNSFHPGVRHLRLQRAVRCDDKQLVWETIHVEQFRANETKFDTAIKVLDAGPNANGRQFLRVLVHSQDNVLSGWAISDFFVSDYDAELFPAAEACFERAD